MIPVQLSICITISVFILWILPIAEELFAKYLYCYPDTGNQIIF